MPVTCPGCATRYVLPSHLLGPSGARICCPACGLTFLLAPDGSLAAVTGQPESTSIAARALLAVQAIDEPPGSLARSEAKGRLFAEHGPAILAAFEALAHDTPGADAAAEFRRALLEVAGLDLSGTSPEPAASRPRDVAG